MTALATPLSMTQTPDPTAAEPRGSASAVGALLGGFLTLGLYPAFAWPGRWAATLEADRRFLTDLAHWWRGHADRRDAIRLEHVVARLRPRPILAVLPWLSAAFVVVAFGVWAANGGLGGSWEDAFGSVTFHYHRDALATLLNPEVRPLHGIWATALFVAYAVHWYAVRSHVSAVSDLVGITNKLAGATRQTRVRDKACQLGLGPLWVLTAIALCFGHAWWSIPMVLAGATQRRYTTKSGPRVLTALAVQARDRTNPTHAFVPYPPPAVARSVALVVCPAPACGAKLPAVARYCSRCGTPVGG